MSGRGLPSWYKYRAYGPVYEEIRLAEHAARLGSIHAFDRRGDVIWFDDFEHGVAKWDSLKGGADADFLPSVAACRNGGLSAKLVCASVTGKYMRIMKYLPYPVLGSFGVEASFTLNPANSYTILDVYLYDGTNWLNVAIQYSLITDRFSYRNSLGSMTVLAENLVLGESDKLFHTWKIAFDAPSQKYKRVILNETNYDLSAQGLWVYPSDISPRMEVRIETHTIGDVTVTSYLDDVIITQNEP